MTPPPTCPACHGPLIQKSRPRLLGVGVTMLFIGLLPLLSPRLWTVAIPGVLTGLYLIVWGTIGRGQWCRHCKNFPFSR